MHERAPDGNQFMQEGPVAFGQAFLRTGRSGAEAPNRLTLDGKVWIAADARIDGRAELVRQLRSAGRDVALDAPHAELILHAYAVHGDDFLDHLIGDFAFALWDSGRDRLICVRDHFGVRPFYYAQKDGAFWFGSDIEALLAVPGMSRDLDDTAVADFLLLGMCTEAEQTIYKNIRCLPPASRMDVMTLTAPTTRRYWAMPRDAETRYPTRAQYVERFTELFEQAVTDRLPDGPVALQLTGGMDSTSIAAVAAPWARGRAQPVTGYHVSASSIEPQDDEEQFARLVADHLGIPLVRQDLGAYPLFSRHADPELHTAFPLSYPQLALHRDTVALIAQSGARVVLSGYSGDSAMSPRPDYYGDLIRRRRLAKAAREIGHHVRHVRSLRGLGLRTLAWPRPASPAWKPPMPHWIAHQPLDLAERWTQWWDKHETAVDAAGLLSLPWMHRQFEALEVFKQPVVARYPFHDVRLATFLAGLPGFMLAGKTVLREAMRGKLPEPVRTRPKTGAAGDFVRTMVTNGKVTGSAFRDVAGLPPQIDANLFRAALENYCSGAGAESTWASWLILQPLAFGHWLSQQKEFIRE